MTTEPNQENYDMMTLEGASKYVADWTHWIVNATDEEYAEAGYDPEEKADDEAECLLACDDYANGDEGF